jgi:hypothetical protein
MLLRYLGTYVIIFKNVYVFIAFATVMLLMDSVPYGKIFMTLHVYYLRHSRQSWRAASESRFRK